MTRLNTRTEGLMCFSIEHEGVQGLSEHAQYCGHITHDRTLPSADAEICPLTHTHTPSGRISIQSSEQWVDLLCGWKKNTIKYPACIAPRTRTRSGSYRRALHTRSACQQTGVSVRSSSVHLFTLSERMHESHTGWVMSQSVNAFSPDLITLWLDS